MRGGLEPDCQRDRRCRRSGFLSRLLSCRGQVVPDLRLDVSRKGRSDRGLDRIHVCCSFARAPFLCKVSRPQKPLGSSGKHPSWGYSLVAGTLFFSVFFFSEKVFPQTCSLKSAPLSQRPAVLIPLSLQRRWPFRHKCYRSQSSFSSPGMTACTSLSTSSPSQSLSPVVSLWVSLDVLLRLAAVLLEAVSDFGALFHLDEISLSCSS